MENEWVSVHVKFEYRFNDEDKNVLEYDTRKVGMKKPTKLQLVTKLELIDDKKTEDETSFRSSLSLKLHENIIGMCVGEARKITFNPIELGAQNETQLGNTIVYEIALINVYGDNEPPMDNVFEFIDSNADTVISLVEWTAFHHRHDPEMSVKLLKVGFDRADKNGNHWIEWKEFDGPKGEEPTAENQFAAIDLDRDGKFSKQDMRNWFLITRDVVRIEISTFLKGFLSDSIVRAFRRTFLRETTAIMTGNFQLNVSIFQIVS